MNIEEQANVSCCRRLVNFTEKMGMNQTHTDITCAFFFSGYVRTFFLSFQVTTQTEKTVIQQSVYWLSIYLLKFTDVHIWVNFSPYFSLLICREGIFKSLHDSLLTFAHTYIVNSANEQFEWKQVCLSYRAYYVRRHVGGYFSRGERVR